MNNYAGSCGKCGAPYSLPNVWHGITPPPPQPTCKCWNTGDVVTIGGSGSGFESISTTSYEIGDSFDIVKIKAEHEEKLKEIYKELEEIYSNANVVNVFDKVKELKEKVESFLDKD